MTPWRPRLLGVLQRYARWLHLRWPAGTVDKLPILGEDGATAIPGLYIAGDLSGVPLLKLALDGGVRAMRNIARHCANRPAAPGTLDVVVIGAGVAGMAAAVEARRLGLAFEVVEAAEPFFTLVNFPRRKPIFTYPSDLTPAGDLQVRAEVKEALVEELREQTRRAGVKPRSARAERVE